MDAAALLVARALPPGRLRERAAADAARHARRALHAGDDPALHARARRRHAAALRRADERRAVSRGRDRARRHVHRLRGEARARVQRPAGARDVPVLDRVSRGALFGAPRRPLLAADLLKAARPGGAHSGNGSAARAV